MDNDERERRDWPAEDRGASPVDPDEPASHDDPSRPMPTEDTTPEGTSSPEAGGEGAGAMDEPAAGEGWRNPEQPDRLTEEPRETLVDPSWGAEEGRAEPSADERFADSAPAEIESWPTEPPAAGSAPDDAWPTAAPERRDEPAGWEGQQQPPEEVEAYPASGAESPDTTEVPAPASATPAHAVPDAEGSTGESTQCPRCGTENRPGLSFCRSCGQRLVAAGASSTVERPGAPEGTMACPRCGTHNRAGVAFCQNCGANLRGTSEGYVPPAAAEEREAVGEPTGGGAILGPVVLLIGLAGLVTAYLLPFLYGSGGSLFERAWGAGGYGVAFWSGYPDVSASLADQAYFGLAGPVPILGLLLVALAVAGFLRAAPGPVQTVGLIVALLWSVGLVVLFVVVELLANWGGDLVGLLRVLTPAGIIFFLSSLIVIIGSLTRFSRG